VRHGHATPDIGPQPIRRRVEQVELERLEELEQLAEQFR